MLHPGTCNASMLTPQEKRHLSAQKTLQAQEVGVSFNIAKGSCPQEEEWQEVVGTRLISWEFLKHFTCE